jgi:hypothetical protein
MSEQFIENYFSMSVNEMATQNVWQHHFLEPCGGGRGALRGKLANRGSEKGERGAEGQIG